MAVDKKVRIWLVDKAERIKMQILYICCERLSFNGTFEQKTSEMIQFKSACKQLFRESLRLGQIRVLSI